MTQGDAAAETCEIVRVLTDGTLVVRWQGIERKIVIDGIALDQPPPPLYFEILERRLPRLRKPLRCVAHSVTAGGRAQPGSSTTAGMTSPETYGSTLACS